MIALNEICRINIRIVISPNLQLYHHGIKNIYDLFEPEYMDFF